MLFIQPAAGPAPIVQMIQASRESVDVNVYELTSDAIENALSTAAARGVRVRILLDGHPYDGGQILAAESQWCAAQIAKLTCKPAPGRFRFDHAKYMVVDGTDSEIGTANLSRSAFTLNREYLFITQAKTAADSLEQVFDADWNDAEAGQAPRAYLVLSPGSETIISKLVSSPGPIAIETEEFGYIRSIVNTLEQKGGDVRIIVPQSISARDRRVLSELQQRGVQVRFISEPYMHAKLIITSQLAFIGSQNFSYTSLNKNREVGVLLQQPNDLKTLRDQFEQDWQHASS